MAVTGYKLYGRKGAGSLAPQIVLEEIGAPYELAWMTAEEARLDSFRRINPAGKIPVLILVDGTPVLESAAILIHLADAYPAAGLAPATGSLERARFLQWMVFLCANVYETALRYYYSERYSSAGAGAAAGIKEQALADYERHLELIQRTLDPYVLGATYSAVDPYLYMLTGWFPGGAAVLNRKLPSLVRHAALLRERPATQTADRDHAET